MFQLNKKHQRYEKYTLTNIDWIGDIPNGWEVWKLKRLGNIETGTTPPKAEEGNYMEDGIPWIKPDNLDGFVPLNDSKEKLSQMGALQARIIKKGSVLVCGIGTIGKIGVAGCDLTTNQQINSITFNQKIDELFGQYLVFASRKEMEKQSNKVVVSILNKSQQSNIFYPVCSLQEQQKIATYLNEKTAILDEAIAKKKNQIGLLSEHRTVLINDAITKGLDKNVEMKESGIEWIGMIPKGWDIQKLKYGINRISRGISPDYSEDETGIKVINQACVYWDGINTKNIKYDKNIDIIKERGLLKVGDLLMNSTGRGTLGRIAYFNLEEQYLADSHITIIRTKKNILNSNFLLYLFSTDIYQGYIYSTCVNGSTNQIELSGTDMKDIPIIYPDIKEQMEIIDYLDKETKYIDDMIAKIEKSIELLEEYKTSLILHAVSGKIKVS